MERLLADAQKLTGIEYNIENLSDIYEAIHVIQNEIGITGTTAKEASETFSGSFASMKAALSDFLGNLTLGNDIMPSLKALGDTVYTFIIGNFLPMVGNMVKGIGTILITTNWGTVVLAMLENLVNTLRQNFNLIWSEGILMIDSFVGGIMENLPAFIDSAAVLLEQFIDFLYDNMPLILQSGINLVISLVTGVIEAIPKVVSSAISLISNLLNTILSGAPRFLESGISLIGKLAAGLINAAPSLIAKIPGIIKEIINKFTSTNWLDVGKNIISGIAKGILNGVSTIISAAKTAANNALSAAKKALGIKSPSTVFKDQVGKMIDEGLAEGIKKNVGTVSDSMKELSKTTVGMIDTNEFKTTGVQISEGYHNKTASLEEILSGVVLQIINNVTVDGTPLKEEVSEYFIDKMGSQQETMLRSKGAFSY